jgi:hypothetical protein
VSRRLPPPWSFEEQDACFVCRQHCADAAPFIDPDQSVLTVNCVLIGKPSIGDNAVPEKDANDLAELGEDILTFDVSDDWLERAAAVIEWQAITIGHCTHWWHCSWPM